MRNNKNNLNWVIHFKCTCSWTEGISCSVPVTLVNKFYRENMKSNKQMKFKSRWTLYNWSWVLSRSRCAASGDVPQKMIIGSHCLLGLHIAQKNDSLELLICLSADWPLPCKVSI